MKSTCDEILNLDLSCLQICLFYSKPFLVNFASLLLMLINPSVIFANGNILILFCWSPPTPPILNKKLL